MKSNSQEKQNTVRAEEQINANQMKSNSQEKQNTVTAKASNANQMESNVTSM